MTEPTETQWHVVTLVVAQEDTGTSWRQRIGPAEKVTGPADWDWADLTHARTYVVQCYPLPADEMVRVELDGDAVWLELGEDGEPTW